MLQVASELELEVLDTWNSGPQNRTRVFELADEHGHYLVWCTLQEKRLRGTKVEVRQICKINCVSGLSDIAHFHSLSLGRRRDFEKAIVSTLRQ